MAKFALVTVIAALVAVSYVEGHGRMMKPPNRSSIWRVPAFLSQNPPANYGDNQLFCGGVHQQDNPGTNCGVCGDPISDPAPRDNEINGKYYRGIITGEYTAGQIIDVEIDLTVSHKGNFEWRLCTNPATETQDCFNQHVLELADGSGTKARGEPTGLHKVQLRLPAGVTCNHCILQWNYRAGNNWGYCEDGTGASGCGAQETFRGCSDIRIS